MRQVNLSGYVFDCVPIPVDFYRVPSIAGVYVFLASGVPMYIGQSDDVRRRVEEHNRDHPQLFSNSNEFGWIQAPDANQRLALERHLINLYKPPYNKQ